MLKEAVLGGGVGATATVVHKNKMGSSFRLIKLVYALDGTQVFARADDTGALHKQKNFEVLTGPIAPGSHTISVLALYRGHGYGVFKYLTKYKLIGKSKYANFSVMLDRIGDEWELTKNGVAFNKMLAHTHSKGISKFEIIK